MPIEKYTYPAMSGARVIEVIETTIARRGAGTPDNPMREIKQYWSLDGILLAENDPNDPPRP